MGVLIIVDLQIAMKLMNSNEFEELIVICGVRLLKNKTKLTILLKMRAM